MQKRIVAISVSLIGLVAIEPPVSQAQVLVAQKSSSSPSSPYQRRQQLDKLLQEGRKLLDAGNFSGAISRYQQAAKLSPKNARIFSTIGYLQVRQGNLSAAAAA